MSRLMEAENQFLAAVSHEIRTPLTAVVGLAQVLDEPFDMLEGDDRRLMISAIAQHSLEVSNLVEDLLVADRVEAGQIDAGKTPVDLVKQVETLSATRPFPSTSRCAPDHRSLGSATPAESDRSSATC